MFTWCRMAPYSTAKPSSHTHICRAYVSVRKCPDPCNIHGTVQTPMNIGHPILLLLKPMTSSTQSLLHPCEWATNTTQTTYKSRQIMDNSSAVHSSSRLSGQQQIPRLVTPACFARKWQSWCVVNFSTTIASDGQKLTERVNIKLIHFIQCKRSTKDN